MENELLNRNVVGSLNAARKSNFTLRMAPMIDVIFLLLIFFLVAAKWRPQEDFLPFKLPTANAGTHAIAKPEPLTINLRATQSGCDVQIGQLYTVSINDQTMDGDMLTLAQQLQKCLITQNRFASDPVELICGSQVKWDHLAKIYNMFYTAGLTDITLPMTEW